MKTIGLSVLAAMASAWIVVTLWATPAPQAPLDLDLQDRLAYLEGRLADLETPRRPPVLGARPPGQDLAALTRRVEQLEAAAAAPAAPESKEAPDPQPPSPQVTEEDTDAKERAARARAAAEIERIGRLPREQQPQSLFDLAMAQRKAGRHDQEEALLRAVIDAAGPASEVAKEAAYQIGWARRGAGDAQGAREAWLQARDGFAPEQARHDYARFYAAESAARSGDGGTALTEVEDLQRDIEDRGAGAADRRTLLERCRQLLAELRTR